LQLERVFVSSYSNTSPGTVILFAGRILDIDCNRTGIEMNSIHNGCALTVESTSQLHSWEEARSRAQAGGIT
jgi:hypothetical protein